jgi:hypothetical protein
MCLRSRPQLGLLGPAPVPAPAPGPVCPVPGARWCLVPELFSAPGPVCLVSVPELLSARWCLVPELFRAPARARAAGSLT